MYVSTQKYKRPQNNKNEDENSKTNKILFSSNSISLIGFNSNNEVSEEKDKNDFNFNKYINLFPAYSIINASKNLKSNYKNKSKRYNFNNLQVGKIFKSEYGITSIEGFQPLLENNTFDIETSLLKDVFENSKENNLISTSSLIKMNYQLFFENTFIIKYDNYYYNRINSNDIKLMEHQKTKTLFYSFPTENHNISLILAEMNEDLQKAIFNDKQNIYDKFVDFGTENTMQKNDNNNKILLTPKNDTIKSIFVPSFSIDTHLFTKDCKEINENVKITDDKNQNLFVETIDEYFKINFNKNDNINDNFRLENIEGDKENAIIKNSFILGVFNHGLFLECKIPFIQIIYVTKENWCKAVENN